MKRCMVVFMFAVLFCSGCAASRGEGVTIGPINTGASQAMRDEIAQERTEAEIYKVEAQTEMERARTVSGIEQGELTGDVWRKVLLWCGLALAVGGVAVGVGYAGAQVAPLAAQAVSALEVKRARRLEISLEVGPSGYVAHLLSEGYNHDEIAQLVRNAPALDGPRVQVLQERVGNRGMGVLLARGELDEAIAMLSAGKDETS